MMVIMLLFSLPGISTPIEAGIVFKALGFNDDEITHLINPINLEMKNHRRFVII